MCNTFMAYSAIAGYAKLFSRSSIMYSYTVEIQLHGHSIGRPKYSCEVCYCAPTKLLEGNVVSCV